MQTPFCKPQKRKQVLESEFFVQEPLEEPVILISVASFRSKTIFFMQQTQPLFILEHDAALVSEGCVIQSILASVNTTTFRTSQFNGSWK